MVNSVDGMFDIKEESFPVTIGDSKSLYATKTRKWKGYTDQNDKISNLIILNFVAYVPDVFVNLFLLTQALKSGSHLGNEGLIITITKQQMVIKFDKIAHTKMASL